jgi:hypothetical protein
MSCWRTIRTWNATTFSPRCAMPLPQRKPAAPPATEAPPGALGTQAAQLPRRAPDRLASPDGGTWPAAALICLPRQDDDSGRTRPQDPHQGHRPCRRRGPEATLKWRIGWTLCASSITTRPMAGGPSPDVEGWSAAGDTYAELVKLAEEGMPFALGHKNAELEHYVPAGEHVAA